MRERIEGIDRYTEKDLEGERKGTERERERGGERRR